MFIDLGRLRAFKSSQVYSILYSIPGGVDLENSGSVFIWCKQFGVLISPAMLSSYEENSWGTSASALRRQG